jgi:hypothetical protein
MRVYLTLKQAELILDLMLNSSEYNSDINSCLNQPVDYIYHNLVIAKLKANDKKLNKHTKGTKHNGK